MLDIKITKTTSPKAKPTGKLGFGNTFKVMICDIKKVDSEGGPNEPDDIFVEKSRLEEFSVNEAWRPVDAPYDEYKANN